MPGADNRFPDRALPTRAADVVVRSIAGETILVPVRGELAEMQQIFVLDEVAELVWNELDGRHTVAQITAAVVDAFDVDESTARRDLEDFLCELAEVGLVAAADRARGS